MGISGQRGAFLKELLNGDLNPCGAGVKPTSCTCADGTSIGGGQGRPQGNGLRGPCGDCSPPSTCTCPDGSEQAVSMSSFSFSYFDFLATFLMCFRCQLEMMSRSDSSL